MLKFDLTNSKLLDRLRSEDEMDLSLYTSFMTICKKSEDFLNRFASNFPTYTDHSIEHSFNIIKYIEIILDEVNINQLNSDERYILLSSAILHDSGMCIPPDKIEEELGSNNYKRLKNEYSDGNNEIDFIRKIHHELSYYFIINNYLELGIINPEYAKVIALISKAHRKVKIDDFNTFELRKTLRTGTEFVCMPYLACILRLADELDITNVRTPEIIIKYYEPDDEKGKKEFAKHKATRIVNRQGKIINIIAKTDSPQVYNALVLMIEKIKKTLQYCQKIIHTISGTGRKHYSLQASMIDENIKTIGFEPKKIKFAFNIDFIFNWFVSKNLYKERTFAIRRSCKMP